MSISVAMATYDGARHISEQLDSIACQSLLPAELVVSDDGSRDETLEIVSAFSRRSPFPVRIVKSGQRLGFADNFLFAAGACQHAYVAFGDQDDVWLPEKLSAAMRRIEADGSDLALHRLTLTNAQLEPIDIWTQGIERNAVFEPLELDPYVNGWGNTMLFKRELATIVPRQRRPRQPAKPERPLSHDTWIYVLAAALGRVSHLESPLVLYRQHENNAMGVERGRLQRMMARGRAFSMSRLRERALFYERMGVLFEELSTTAEEPIASSARGAALRYEARRSPLARRLGAYYEPALAGRLLAYRANVEAMPSGLRSRAKDLLLGVSGLQRLLG